MAATIADFSNTVLLTVHGVCSDNTGLKQLGSYCEQKLPGLIVDNFFYHKIIPLRNLDPETAKLIADSVRMKTELTFREKVKGKGRKFFIAAHSFGTLATIKAIQMGLRGR
jgi:hypothetical protein